MSSTESASDEVLLLSSGSRLRYTTRGPRSRAAVVPIHGWPDSWRSFEPVLDALSPDIGVLAVSLRGFGGSDAPPSGYEPTDFAHDVAEAIEQVGVTSAVVVGHSLGALVAQRLAIDRPDLVAGVVMIGGFARLPDAVADEVWSAVVELTDPIDEEFVREFQSSTLAAPVPAAFFEQLVAESRRISASVWRAAWAGVMGADHRDQLAGIAAPTLLIWGDRDGLVPRSEQDLLASAIPDARLVVYEGSGHSPNWEQPERVASDIEAFARTVPGGFPAATTPPSSS
ncbi:MAG TPA: alpha/beta hydrolase [Acidimicrobiia bacterium]